MVLSTNSKNEDKPCSTFLKTHFSTALPKPDPGFGYPIPVTSMYWCALIRVQFLFLSKTTVTLDKILLQLWVKLSRFLHGTFTPIDRHISIFQSQEICYLTRYHHPDTSHRRVVISSSTMFKNWFLKTKNSYQLQWNYNEMYVLLQLIQEI